MDRQEEVGLKKITLYYSYSHEKYNIVGGHDLPWWMVRWKRKNWKRKEATSDGGGALERCLMSIEDDHNGGVSLVER